MGWAFVGKFAIKWVLIVLVHLNGHSSGCLEEERRGLLELKDFLKSNGAVADRILPTWTDRPADHHLNECCDWERVTCDPTTGHVTELSLYNIRDISGREYFYGHKNFNVEFESLSEEDFREYFQNRTWFINASVFLPFKELRNLNLSRNLFSGWIDNQGFEGLSSLRKLEKLDLGSNLFNDSNIFRYLGALASIKTLIVSYNSLGGYFPAHELVALRNLETLDIGSNGYIGCLPLQGFEKLSILRKLETLNLENNEFNNSLLPSLSALTSLKTLNLAWNKLEGLLLAHDFKLLSKWSKMRHLDLSRNSFDKEILRILGALPSLKFLSLAENVMEGPLSNQELTYNVSNLEVLSLRGNQLNGTLPMEGLCELQKLEELDLNYNHFEGILPPCLSNLTSLRLLDLYANQFTGNHLSSLLGSLNSLEYIDLRYNRFEGLFSFSSFANHSMLQVVAITSDNDKFEVETEYKDWLPLFQLKVLVLPNSNLNKRSGDFPKFLLLQNKLSFIDLSHNNLEGSFPNWLLVNNTELEFLSLRNNSFVGEFWLSPYYNSYTNWMDVSNNQLIGHIQLNMGEMVPYLIHINLSRNAFEGCIPSSIGKMRILEVLDLSSNNLSGEVPKQLVRNCRSLRSLELSNNKFRGRMFSDDFKLTQIEYLRLNDNQFIGPLTNVVFNLSELYLLDISNNNMSGKILGSMNNMISLRTLIMRNNAFNGQFPCALVPNVFMDISHNSFSGSLPSCSNPNLGIVGHMHLKGNKFAGFIPKALLNSSKLVTLDVSDNNLSGSIPLSIRLLSNLRILLLRGNQLGGSIPTQLCQLNKISLMDLSKNSFTGSIPRCLSNITFGAIGATNLAFTQTPLEFYSTTVISYEYENDPELRGVFEIGDPDGSYDKVDEVEFVTKSRTNSYLAGSILNFMSGLDLSCNKLAGEIPFELGKLSGVRALNLSHNLLTGPIPKTFSSLTQVESLDLSYNRLSGNIPTELINLNFLEVFTVAHNNLSGKILDRKAQFGTFEASSYEGNPFLCGPPLEKNCRAIVDLPYSPTTASSDETKGKWYDIDRVAFSASFVATYITFLFGFAVVLYINPYWRQRWLDLIEEGMCSSYYFVYDTLYKLLRFQPSV
ncbi:Receptor-like protein 13 [Camellia lanceoleosa]|nr:Receptor-like protein 13 [Camellia lanceoleosa]